MSDFKKLKKLVGEIRVWRQVWTGARMRSGWRSGRKIVEECSRRPSGMTVTAWTEEHGIGVKSYYYWQRRVRRAMAQLMQPQLPSVVPEKQVAFAEIECQPSQTPPETLEMFKPDAVLRRGDVLIGISNSVSDSLLRIILENLSHAG